MTKIWCLDWDESVYTDAALADVKALIGIPLSSGRSLSGNFPDHPAVELRSGDTYADFVMAGPVFLVSDRSKAILDGFEANAEFFEVDTDTNSNMFFCNLLETVDCLNRSASEYEIEYGAASVERLVLEPVQDEPPIYRVAETNPLVIAVRDDVVDLIISAGIVGVEFKAIEDWTNPMLP